MNPNSYNLLFRQICSTEFTDFIIDSVLSYTECYISTDKSRSSGMNTVMNFFNEIKINIG